MKNEPELYKPAEACRIAEVAPYVLRYWETEFPALSEGGSKGAARLYTSRDVRIIGRIRQLLYDEGFTVAGAKKRLEAEISEGRFDESSKPAPPSVNESDLPEFLLDASPPAKAASAAASKRTESSPSDFPDRKRVLKELKEISKILDRGRRTR